MRLDKKYIFSKPLDTVDIEDYPFSVGHILIHYLITDQYQCLKPEGETEDERSCSELATAFKAHAAAVDLELPLSGDYSKLRVIRHKIVSISLEGVQRRNDEPAWSSRECCYGPGEMLASVQRHHAHSTPLQRDWLGGREGLGYKSARAGRV
ncbi:hypothetical protein LB505_000887 [Fusarium chuoi]|nr:hypothetical protein LB505_000887 [Fusarium chuoi]